MNNVTICNNALVKLGQDIIVNLGADNPRAKACNSIFDISLDLLLQKHEWNFAVELTTLALIAEAPEFEYTYQHQLPTDPYCLQVIQFYPDFEFKIIGRTLHSDQETVELKYIKRVTNLNDLSPTFVESLSLYLAAQLSIILLDNPQVKEQMTRDYHGMLNSAKLLDSQEDTSSKLMVVL